MEVIAAPLERLCVKWGEHALWIQLYLDLNLGSASYLLCDLVLVT